MVENSLNEYIPINLVNGTENNPGTESLINT